LFELEAGRAAEAEGNRLGPAELGNEHANELTDERANELGDELGNEADPRRQRAGDWPPDDDLMRAMGLGPKTAPAGAALVANQDRRGTAATAPAPAAAPTSAPVPTTPAPASSAAAGRAPAAPAPARSGNGSGVGSRQRPAGRAAPTPQPSTDEPAQHATWTEVSAAAKPAGRQVLDLAWIDSLPAHLREAIDREFSEERKDASVHKAAVAGDRNARKALEARRKQLRAEAAARLDPQHPRRVRKAAIDAEPVYRIADELLRQEFAIVAELRHAAAEQEPRAAGSPAESVAAPPEAQITRGEGVARARTDFMAWAIEMTGSAAKAKAHYLSIREVPDRPGLWLAADASARFIAARLAFEAAHPGYTFGSTGGQAMRGLHQERKGIGMHGHSLGFAVDILAFDNPNLKPQDREPSHINHFFLERFGRDEAGTSRATMNLAPQGDQRIETLGKHTAEGTSTADDEAFVQQIRTQFAEISATSKRFQASIAAELPKLQEARNFHFMQPELKAKIAQVKKDMRNVDALARQELAKEKFQGDEAAKHERLREIANAKRNELDLRIPELQLLLDEAKIKAPRLRGEAFASWTAELRSDAAMARERLVQAQQAHERTQTAIQTLRTVASTTEALIALATQFDLGPFTEANPRRLRQKLASALQKQKSANGKSLTYHSDELGVLVYAIEKLQQPELVFGKGRKKSEGVYETESKVSEVPLMQYLERGHIRDDAMPAVAGQSRKGVFNADVVATLARYGFSPGSTFGDTMHFDFIEGYNRVVPGGRSQTNLRKDRFGPRGTVDREQ
jgi:hypothetical protein